MNLIKILNDYGIEYRIGGSHKNVRDGWIGLDCPWCGPQTQRFHLGINLIGRPHASCWSCGTHRAVEVFQVLGLPTSLLGELEAAPVPIRPKGSLSVPHGTGSLMRQHRRYLQGRGFDPDELVRLWDLRGIGIAPRLGWSIWIPIVMHGEIVSWTTRSLVDSGSRYVSARPEEENIPIKETLYGWDYVQHAVVIVEGPADAWRIGPGTVATFGVNVSDEQVRLLSSVPYRMICFDNDEAGDRRADDLAERLLYSEGETYVAKLDSADAGSATPQEVSELRGWLKNGIQVDTTDRRAVGRD